MTDSFGFIPFDPTSTNDFGFIGFNEPVSTKRAKGIGKIKRSEESLRRSDEAFSQLFKGIPQGAYKTLRAISGSEKLPDINAFQHFIETGETVPSTEERLSDILGLQSPITPEQKLLRRVGETAGSLPFLGITPSTAVPLLGGAAIGGGIEAATNNPLAGDVGEAISSLGLGTLKGGAKFSSSFEELAKRARKLGFTDKELSALSREKAARTFLAKRARKGTKAENLTNRISEAFNTAYEGIAQEAASLGPISKQSEQTLSSNLEKILSNLKKTVKPSAEKESAIKYLDDSLTELFQKGATPEELINWYQDVNSTINWNAIGGGKRKLAAIKDPIVNAIRETSPELAQDFQAINELYSRNADLYKALKPGQLETFFNQAEIPAAVFGVLTGHPKILYEVFGRAGAKRIAYEMLANPRLQGLQRKLGTAVKEGRVLQARKLAERIENIYSELGIEPVEDLPSTQSS